MQSHVMSGSALLRALWKGIKAVGEYLSDMYVCRWSLCSGPCKLSAQRWLHTCTHANKCLCQHAGHRCPTNDNSTEAVLECGGNQHHKLLVAIAARQLQLWGSIDQQLAKASMPRENGRKTRLTTSWRSRTKQTNKPSHTIAVLLYWYGFLNVCHMSTSKL